MKHREIAGGISHEDAVRLAKAVNTTPGLIRAHYADCPEQGGDNERPEPFEEQADEDDETASTKW